MFGGNNWYMNVRHQACLVEKDRGGHKSKSLRQTKIDLGALTIVFTCAMRSTTMAVKRMNFKNKVHHHVSLTR